MRFILLKFSVLLACLFLLTPNHVVANESQQNLAEPLKVFSKFLGTWESTFVMMDGNPNVVDVAVWERALNGKAIRSLHSINDGMYGGEMLMFWDEELNSLVFYYFTTAEFYTKGTIEVVSENSFIAYEDVSGSEDGISKVKSTSTLTNGDIKVTTAYLKHGEWTEPETRTYTPSTKTVKFK